jgi:hypothetical protein
MLVGAPEWGGRCLASWLLRNRVGELSFLFIFFVLCLRLVLLWPAFGGVHPGGAELRVVRLPDLTPLSHPPQGSCSPFARNLGRCSCRIYPPASAQAQHIRAQAVFVLLHTPHPHLHSPLCRAKLAHQETKRVSSTTPKKVKTSKRPAKWQIRQSPNTVLRLDRRLKP